MNKGLVAMMCCASITVGTWAEDLEFHGFLTQSYVKTQDNPDWMSGVKNSDQGTAEWTEAGLNFSTEFDDFSVGAQILMRNFGDRGNLKAELDWGFGEYSFSDWFGIRAGKVKIPSGFKNEARDVDASRVSILLPQNLYIEGWREFVSAVNGVNLFGYVGDNFEYTVVGGVIDIPSDFDFNGTLTNVYRGGVSAAAMGTAGAAYFSNPAGSYITDVATPAATATVTSDATAMAAAQTEATTEVMADNSIAAADKAAAIATLTGEKVGALVAAEVARLAGAAAATNIPAAMSDARVSDNTPESALVCDSYFAGKLSYNEAFRVEGLNLAYTATHFKGQMTGLNPNGFFQLDLDRDGLFEADEGGVYNATGDLDLVVSGHTFGLSYDYESWNFTTEWNRQDMDWQISGTLPFSLPGTTSYAYYGELTKQFNDQWSGVIGDAVSDAKSAGEYGRNDLYFAVRYDFRYNFIYKFEAHTVDEENPNTEDWQLFAVRVGWFF